MKTQIYVKNPTNNKALHPVFRIVIKSVFSFFLLFSRKTNCHCPLIYILFPMKDVQIEIDGLSKVTILVRTRPINRPVYQVVEPLSR